MMDMPTIWDWIKGFLLAVVCIAGLAVMLVFIDKAYSKLEQTVSFDIKDDEVISNTEKHVIESESSNEDALEEPLEEVSVDVSKTDGSAVVNIQINIDNI